MYVSELLNGGDHGLAHFEMPSTLSLGLTLAPSTLDFTRYTSATLTDLYFSKPDFTLFAVEDDDFADDSTTTGLITLDGAALSVMGDFEGDQDWLAIDLTAGDIVLFEAADARLVLYDANGVAVRPASNNNGPIPFPILDELDFLAESSGRYYIGVTAPEGQSVSVRASTIVDDFTADVNTTGTVVLNGLNNTVRNDYVGDEDWLTFSAQAGDLIEFTANNQFTGISFYDASGNQIGTQISAINSFTATSSGTYFVGVQYVDDFNIPDLISFQGRVVSSGNDTTDDFDGDSSTDGVVGLDGVGVSGVINFQGDSDWFAVNAQAGQEITLLLESDDPNVSITLRDANGNELQSSFVGLFVARADVTATFYVDIAYSGTFSTPIDYTLKAGTGATAPLGFGDVVGNNKDAAGTFDIEGGPITGVIDYSGDADWYAITVQAGDRVVFDLEDISLLDPELFLADGNGTIIAENDDFGGGLDSRIDWTFDSAGTYYIIADSRGVTGQYRLEAELTRTGPQPVNDAVGDTAATAFSFELDAGFVESAIDFAGDEDWFEITVEAGDQVTFGLAELSAGFDSVLTLRDANGAFLTANSNDFPEISYLFDTGGTFYLVASAVGNGTGHYRLSADVVPGDTVVSGDSGDNRLEGDNGADRIDGGAGDDVLIGFGGDDTMTGGAGADIFVIDYNVGLTTVMDFALSEDRVALDFGPYYDWDDILARLSDTSEGALLNMGDGSFIRLNGIMVSDLNLSNFVIGFEDPDGTGPLRDGTYIFDWDEKPTIPAEKLDDLTPVAEVIDMSDGQGLSKLDTIIIEPDWWVDDGFML